MMSPSQEHDDVLGAAPARKESAAVQLDRTRAELAQAEKQLAPAEAAMDTKAVVRWRETVAVLKGFIERLEVEAAAEREAQGVKAAKARLRVIEREYASLAQELEAGD